MNEAVQIEPRRECCSSPAPLQSLVYDLGDSSRWEYFFPNVDKPLLIVPPGEDRPKESFDVRSGVLSSRSAYVDVCVCGRGIHGVGSCNDLSG